MKVLRNPFKIMSDPEHTIPSSITVTINTQRVALPVLGMGKGWLVVEKPEGVLTQSHGWYPKEMGLEQGLNALMNDEDRRERFREFFVGDAKVDVRAVYDVDREISGASIFVFDENAMQKLRNAYGSQQLEFVFRFFTRGSINDHGDRVCDLPLAAHFSEPRMLVSHQSGKKTHTEFRFLEQWGPISMWEARANFVRCHQLRLHAVEVGLPIMGEEFYANEAPLYLSELKRMKKMPEVEEPICPGLCLHLSEVSWSAEQVKVDMPDAWVAPLRPKMNILIKRLREKYG